MVRRRFFRTISRIFTFSSVRAVEQRSKRGLWSIDKTCVYPITSFVFNIPNVAVPVFPSARSKTLLQRCSQELAIAETSSTKLSLKNPHKPCKSCVSDDTWLTDSEMVCLYAPIGRTQYYKNSTHHISLISFYILVTGSTL